MFGKSNQGPPPLRAPGSKYEPEPEPEPFEVSDMPEMPEATGLDGIGEEFGLDPASTRQFARKIMRHFMGQCGGGAEMEEADESETEEHPE
ncbi:MAG TPA: hypothetical protein VN428_02345 [Bryobacteraceae bacterium]|nr:hypothetical protein [Bryobacteraceae bacterium]